jgi:Resolvase, N terminal domain
MTLPAIEGATGKFLLQQMAAVAELEAGMISARTKAALAAAKRRGKKLGGDRGARLTAKARTAGRAVLQARAQERASDLAATVKVLQAAGAESLRAIAEGLESQGIPAAPNWPTRQFASRDVGNSRRHPFGARSVTPPSVLKSGLARVAVPEQVAGSLARGPCRSAAGYGRGRRILSSAHPLIFERTFNDGILFGPNRQ